MGVFHERLEESMAEPITGAEAYASWLTGKQMGRDEEYERLLKILTDYFEVAQLPGDYPDHNPWWDTGFQAAIALLVSHKKIEKMGEQE